MKGYKMLTKLKKMILTAAAALVLAVPAALPVAVYAQDPIKCGVNSGAELDLSGENCEVEAGSGANSLQGLITKIINIFSVIVGVIAVIMIIFGGLKYITSGGDSGNVSSAKNTIIFALVGLVIVALAQFIVRFVLTQTNSISS